MKKSKKITALMAALSVFGLTGCDLGSISDSIKNFDVWNLVDPLHWFHDKEDKDQDQDKDDDKDVAVTSVVVTPSTLSLKEGESRLLSVEVLPSNATNKTVTWTSTNPEVATVSNGNVVAVKEGSATIKATADGKEGQCVVTVTKDGEDTPPVPVEITEIVSVNGPAQLEQDSVVNKADFTLTVKYSDGTTHTANPDRIELSTAVVGDAIQGTAYINQLSKTFTIKIVAKEVPPVTDTITPQKAIELMDAAGEGVVVTGLQKVKGICAANTKYDTQYKQYTTGFEGVDNFKVQFTDTNNILNGASPDGMEIVVEGYLEKYQGKYQLSYLPASSSPTGEKFTPNLVSATAAVHEGVLDSITVSAAHREFYKGSTFVEETVTAHYSDGASATVKATFSGYDMNTLGEQTVTVSYTEKGVTKQTTYTINVIERGSGHAGTLEDPLTTAEAVTIANGLAETTDSKDPIASEGMYVKGVVTEFKETFSANYGNYSIVIGGDFTLWRIKNGPDFAKFNEGDIEVGDEVIAFVYIMNYKGTPESTSSSYVYSVQKAGDTKTLQSIEIVGSLTKTSYVEGQAYSSAGLSVKGHYDDGSEGTVAATITLNKTTAALGDTEIIASATFKEITAEPKTFTVTVTEKVPVVGGSVYTFKNDKASAQNVGTWTSEQFMKCVEVDGGEIITGMKNATNAYIGGNGGSGDTTWNIWDSLKVGKSSAKGEITLLLDGTASFSKIKVSAIGARDDGTLTINEITQNVTKKATKADLEPIELEYEITGGITELKLSSKDAASNNYGIVITRIEFVGGETPNPDPVLSSLVLTHSPTKTEYFAGQEFNAEGMVITAKYTNGGSDKVLQPGEYIIDKTTLAIGDTFVTVSYTDGEVTKTIQVPVTVTKAPVPVTGITLNKTAISMHVLDADIQLTATVTPDDADDKTVVWTVSENGIVTVENGLVHAVAAGEVVVTATAGDFSATCTVTVVAAEKVISGISIANMPSKTTYVEGETFNPEGMAITITYTSAHEPETITSGFTYEQGALTLGKNAVEIDYNGFKTNVSITVTPAPVLDSISVANAEGKTNTYTVGAVISKDDLVVTAHYTQGKQDAVVTDYTISKTTALAVTDTSVTISYTEGGIEKTATYSFTVTKPTEPQIDVSNVDLYSIDAASLGLDSYADGTNTDLAWAMLCKGNSDTLQGNSSKSSELHNKIAFSKNITYIKFNVGYAAGEAATGSVRFGSSVTPTGNDTSYGANTDLSLVTVGSFNVSAPAGCNYFSVVWTKGASYFSSIEVHFDEMGSEEQVAVQSVSLNKTSTSINVGSNETLVATVAPSNANDKSVTWSSSNSSIATVDSTGKVTGIAQGTATITVTTTDGEKTATCSVTVVPAGSTTSSPIDLGGSATVVFNGTSYSNSIKAGTGSAAGSTTISVPSGANKLTFYAAGWNKESVKLSVTGTGLSTSTLTLTSDAGVSGNGPTYTVGATTEASFKFEIDVSTLSGGSLTLTATSGKRFVVWNASYTK